MGCPRFKNLEGSFPSRDREEAEQLEMGRPRFKKLEDPSKSEELICGKEEVFKIARSREGMELSPV